MTLPRSCAVLATLFTACPDAADGSFADARDALPETNALPQTDVQAETDIQAETDASPSNVRTVVFTMDLDPGGSPLTTDYPAANWSRAQALVERATDLGLQLTIFATPQWADYVAADPSGARLATIRSWETLGHELGVHHHSPRHPVWDGYVNDTTSYSAVPGAAAFDPKYSGRTIAELVARVSALPATGTIHGGGMTDDSWANSINLDQTTHDFDGQHLAYRRIQGQGPEFEKPIAGCSYILAHTSDGTPARGTISEAGMDGAETRWDTWHYLASAPAILRAGTPSATWNAVATDLDTCVRLARPGDLIVFGMHPEEYDAGDGRAEVWNRILEQVLSQRADGLRVEVRSAASVLGL